MESSATYNIDPLAELALKMDEVIRRHQKVDWHDNMEIHKRIDQDLDDLLFEFKKAHQIELDYDTIDKIIEQVKTVALRRY
jgi:type I restriction enzyme R subunit